MAAFEYVWAKMTWRNKQLSAIPVEIRVDVANLGSDIYFYDKFIITKKDNLVKVLSNKCTHAGCRISNEQQGELICSCHGSRFDTMSGKVLNGPALLPLPSIDFTTDKNTGEILIKL